MARTSDHIVAAKTGAEAHNRRTKTLSYVRSELTSQNESWEADEFRSVHAAITHAQKLYKQLQGRKLPSNANPIREGVVVIKADTSLDDVKAYAAAVEARFGVRPLAIYLHKDEGHVGQRASSPKWTPNLHAHIIWDFQRKDGTMIAIGRQGCRDLQTMAAQALGMERGKASDARHLTSIEYKVKKETEQLEAVRTEADTLIAKKEKAEKALETQIRHLEEAQQRGEDVEQKIREKQAKLDMIRQDLERLIPARSALSGLTLDDLANLQEVTSARTKLGAKLQNLGEVRVGTADARGTTAIYAKVGGNELRGAYLNKWQRLLDYGLMTLRDVAAWVFSKDLDNTQSIERDEGLRTPRFGRF